MLISFYEKNYFESTRKTHCQELEIVKLEDIISTEEEENEEIVDHDIKSQ